MDKRKLPVASNSDDFRERLSSYTLVQTRLGGQKNSGAGREILRLVHFRDCFDI